MFGVLPDHPWHILAEPFGAGSKFFLGPHISADADVCSTFLSPDTDPVIHRDFNYREIPSGLNFFF
jgi:hypothetical protein